MVGELGGVGWICRLRISRRADILDPNPPPVFKLVVAGTLIDQSVDERRAVTENHVDSSLELEGCVAVHESMHSASTSTFTLR